jgi:hypothetical protein
MHRIQHLFFVARYNLLSRLAVNSPPDRAHLARGRVLLPT